MNLGWKTRVGVVLSAVWVCLVFMVADDYHRGQQVLGFGLLPLVVLWGIAWAVSGWRAQRPRNAAETGHGHGRWSPRLKSVGAVLICLFVGVMSASWQYHLAGYEGQTPVPRWVGEWLVWGLLSYVGFRAVPRIPSGLAPMLAALVVVSGVNFKAYQALALEREVKASAAKAAPLISQIDRGENPTDDEVRQARLGLLEPLILAKVASARETLAIAKAHERALASLEPELWLSPSSLATPEARQMVLRRLEQSRQEVAEYKAQIEAATARSRLSFKAVSAQMPTEIGDSVMRGFDDTATRFAAYVNDYSDASKQLVDAATEVVTSLENAPRGFVIVKGPPQNILFKDQASLDAYRDQMSRVMAAGQRIQQARLSLLNANRLGIDKLRDSLTAN